jgi:hypothetical protein
LDSQINEKKAASAKGKKSVQQREDKKKNMANQNQIPKIPKPWFIKVIVPVKRTANSEQNERNKAAAKQKMREFGWYPASPQELHVGDHVAFFDPSEGGFIAAVVSVANPLYSHGGRYDAVATRRKTYSLAGTSSNFFWIKEPPRLLPLLQRYDYYYY